MYRNRSYCVWCQVVSNILLFAQEEVETGRGQFVVGQIFSSLTTFIFLNNSNVCQTCIKQSTNQINNQSIIPSTNVIQLTLTLKMTTAQVFDTSVTVNNNGPIQDYVHLHDQTQPTLEMTPGFKTFTVNLY